MAGLALYCRTGFEKDLANEVLEKSAELNVYGYPELKANSGLVLFHCYQEQDADALAKKLPLSSLIFARQLFAFSERCEQLDTNDRIGPILNGCIEFPECGELRVEHADSTEGREISKFCRKISVPLRQALRGKRILTPLERSNLPVCHCLLYTSDAADE